VFSVSRVLERPSYLSHRILLSTVLIKSNLLYEMFMNSVGSDSHGNYEGSLIHVDSNSDVYTS
jgi:hypothetical protein